MTDNLIQGIEKARVIAIIRGVESSAMLKLAHALYDGGIRFMEVTFDHKTMDFCKTASAIEALKKEFGDEFGVGAGTVTSVELVHTAKNSGAQYIISPDCNTEVIKETKKLGLVSIPGAMTPSEILQAHSAGADFVKVFPSGCLGLEYIKALKGPIPHVRLLAVGGINAENVGAFIKAGCVGAGIGGKLANLKLIEENRFDAITASAKEIIKAVMEA